MSKADWNNINFEEVYNLVDEIGEETGLILVDELHSFVRSMELIRDKQIKEETKHICALLKKN